MPQSSPAVASAPLLLPHTGIIHVHESMAPVFWMAAGLCVATSRHFAVGGQLRSFPRAPVPHPRRARVAVGKDLDWRCGDIVP